jgi:ADP-ribose pyrophosphatase YjhB (NUDIX family)
MSELEYLLRPLTGVGAVLIDAGCVLLIRQSREPSLGEWSLPGGTGIPLWPAVS